MSDRFDNGQGPGAQTEGVDFAAILDDVVEVVEKAKSMPLSSSVIISREEILNLLGAARDALPSELARAQRILVDRNELMLHAEREANEILDEGRSQAAYLVQRTEVVRQARHQAERLVLEAETDAANIRRQADDYVDRKLAAFEIVLDRTTRTVQAGRERLRPVGDQADIIADVAQGAGENRRRMTTRSSIRIWPDRCGSVTAHQS